MTTIIPNIITLTQHVLRLQTHFEDYRPKKCTNCGKSGLWYHGYYIRKSNRRDIEFETDEAIKIPRFLCPSCHKTCSSLPEVIPPHRHYLWGLQQAILLQLLSGIPLNEVAEQQAENMGPSCNTIRCWWRRFQDRFTVDKSDLLSTYDLTGLWAELARTKGLNEFWLTCLDKISLAKAMFHLHNMGKRVP